MQLVSTLNQESNSSKLEKEFVTGLNMNIQLSNTVYERFYPDDDVDYLCRVNDAKRLLNTAKVTIIGKEIITVDVNEHTDRQMKTAVLRLVNLAHHARYIVVLNNQVIYSPDKFRNVPAYNLNLYVTLNILEEKKKNQNPFMRAIRMMYHDVKLTISRGTH